MRYFVAPINIHPYLTFSLSNRLKYPSQIADDILELKQYASSIHESLKLHIVMLDVMEGRIYDKDALKMLQELEEVVKTFDIGYTFILDGDNEELSKVKGINNVIYSDFLVISSYVNSVLPEDQECNDLWDNTKSKGLWTIGRVERPHRSILMSKLWENKLLEKLDWSFYTYPDNREYIHKTFLNHYDDSTFERFIKECTRSLDFTHNTEANFHTTGYPFDPDIYRNTSFSIIAETDFNVSHKDQVEFTPKVTEKTYRTIINRHPFICAWYPGMIKKLKSKGYRTFEEYTANPNYNDILDLDARINALVTNIDTFHECLNRPDVVEKVRADIEYNYQHYLKKVDIEISKLQPIFDVRQISSVKITLTSLGRFMFPRNNELFGKPSDLQ